MSKNIKGITIEIGGETTGLDKALKNVNSTVKTLQSELKQVNTALKFDTGNPVLLSQKMDILKNAIAGTTEKLDTLKKAQADVDKQFAEGKISEEQYRGFQREIIFTESQLKKFETQLESTENEIKGLGDSTDESSNDINKFGKAFDDALKNVNSTTKDLQNELKQVNSALKLDTDNPVLLSQKMSILKEAIANTSEKLVLLKNTQEDVNRKFAEGEISEQQYREFQRELINTEAELKDFESQLSDTDNELRGLNNSADNSADEVEELGESFEDANSKVISFGDALKTSIVTDFIVEAVKKAIDVVKEFSRELVENAATVQAEQAQYKAAFGELENDATKMIKSISTETGVLDERLKIVATSGFSQFKGAGMEANKALENTEKFLGFAADAAAYFDTSLEDTESKLRSFIRGNTSAGDSIGLFTSEAQRNEKAVQMMGAKFTELSEAQKQLVMMSIVEEIYAVNGAMGQAAREAEGWENVQGNLKEAWKQFTAVLGEPILETIIPIVQGITTKLVEIKPVVEDVCNNVKEKFGDMSTKIGEVSTFIKDEVIPRVIDGFNLLKDNAPLIAAAIAGVVGALVTLKAISVGASIVTGISNIVGGFKLFAGSITTASSGATAFSGILAAITSPVAIAVAAIGVLVAGIVYLYNTNDDFREAFLEAWEKVKEGLQKAVSIIVEKLKALGEDIKDLFNRLKPVIDEAIQNIKKIIETVFEHIKAFWDEWGSTIIQFFTMTLENLSVVFKTVWDLIKGIIEGAINIIAGIIKTVTGIITGDWELAWEGIKQILSTAWDTMTAILDSILSGVKEIFGNIIDFLLGIDLAEIGRNLMEGLANGIKSGLNSAKEFVSNGISEIKNLFTGVSGFDTHSPSVWAESIGNFVGDGLSIGFSDGLEGAKKVAGEGLENIKSIFQSMADDRRLHDVTALEEKIQLIDKEISETKKALEKEQYERDLAEKKSNLNTAKNAKERESIQKDINKMIADNEKKINDERLSSEKEFLQEKINLIKESQSKINDLGGALVSALKSQYEKQRDAHLSSLEKEVEDVRKANDQKLKEYENDYLNKVSFMDSELAEQIKAINNQIAGIDAQTEQEEKALKEQEYNKRLAEKQKALATAESAEEIARIQEEINEMISKRERELLLERRTQEKNSLREQIDAIKEDYAQRKELLEQDYENQKETAQNTLETVIDAKDKEMEKAKEHFEKLLSEENLNAEARKMLINNNNEDIINILATYNPKWLDQGRTFADKLLNGINEGRPAIESAISEIMNMLNGVNESVSQTISNAYSVSADVSSSFNEAFSDFESYTIQYGDTLTSIAKKYNTTVDALVSANAIQDRNKIQSGQNISIPVNVTTTLDGKVISQNVSEHIYDDYSKASRGVYA